MVVAMLRIPLPPSRHAEVIEVLRSVQGRVQSQQGCEASHIYQEQGQDPAVVLIERWASKAALESHIRSESYLRVLCAIELAAGPPEVSFDVVSATEGMELIERLREPGGADEAL